MKDCFQALTDSEWQLINNIQQDQRQRSYHLRAIWDAIFWQVWTGSQWRTLTKATQIPYQSVYYYFRRWKNQGLFEQIKDELLRKRRQQVQRFACPSAVTFDSQSVKAVAFTTLDTGIDGHKRIKGRKRHLAVDQLGYPVAILVTAAHVSDSQAGKCLADRLSAKITYWSQAAGIAPRLVLIRADAGYNESFQEYVEKEHEWLVSIVQKPESGKGFVPQAGRWQVERSFGWLQFRRRLARDYEKTVESSEAMLALAFISFLLPKLVT